MDFKESLREKTSRINREISEYLPPETGFQKTILAACNYSVINGGKRLRPLLMQYAYILCRNSYSNYWTVVHGSYADKHA